MKAFGERLRGLRETQGWSQEKLGFELGVTKATISKWENGQAQPRLEQLPALKRLFADQGVTLDALLDDRAGRRSGAARQIAEPSSDPYQGDPRLARSQNELQLLLRFRALSRPRQRALLKLLADED
ncbi:MAG: helix-turn-helix domain-containing protein [Gammaproteobacteria bacterium]